MNERLQELARQAGFYANPDVEKFEKFAELIVKECCNVILEWKAEPFPLDPDFAAKLIREHFKLN